MFYDYVEIYIFENDYDYFSGFAALLFPARHSSRHTKEMCKLGAHGNDFSIVNFTEGHRNC